MFQNIYASRERIVRISWHGVLGVGMSHRYHGVEISFLAVQLARQLSRYVGK